MVAKAFVDTNILLRAMIPQMNQHSQCESLVQKLWDDDVELWINRQVIREYTVQATHPNSFSPPLTITQIITQMNTITTLLRVADETQTITAKLFELLANYPTTRGKQVHDTNLVATMLVYGIDTLVTLNESDFRRFGSLIKIVTIV
ncbi:MAG: type II toxin-antitoxin system VapC family toxin [bacterium]|nr:type II toxin-antitoxin system VapC family toxin [bacterium]